MKKIQCQKCKRIRISKDKTRRTAIYIQKKYPLCRMCSTGGTPEQRFWEKVKKSKTGCWLWTGAPSNNEGYGRLLVNGKYISTHRFSFKIHKGNPPKKFCVLHTCDNPSCVNPKHLWLGTRDDNNKDRENKGRGVYLKGENSSAHKLTWKDVVKIRKIYNPKKMSSRVIGNIFNMDKSTILDIVNNKTWKI